MLCRLLRPAAQSVLGRAGAAAHIQASEGWGFGTCGPTSSEAPLRRLALESASPKAATRDVQTKSVSSILTKPHPLRGDRWLTQDVSYAAPGGCPDPDRALRDAGWCHSRLLSAVLCLLPTAQTLQATAGLQYLSASLLYTVKHSCFCVGSRVTSLQFQLLQQGTISLRRTRRTLGTAQLC